MWILLWFVSQPTSHLQLKFTLTPTPVFLFGNSWTHPHFILCFPCPCLVCPQTFTVILLLSLCSACQSLFFMKLGRLLDAAGILTKNLQGCKSLSGSSSRGMCKWADKCHEALTRLFRRDDVERKWTCSSLGCCVLSAIHRIYFTFAGHKDYVKAISGCCPERTVCPYDCLISFSFFPFLS